MVDRPTRLGLHAPALIALTLVAGCASLQNTPKQDYVWAMWDQCKATGQLAASTLQISRVEPDGRYWTNTTAGPFEVEWPKLQACMNDQCRAHPYLDWLKARQASARSSAGVAAPPVAALSGPVMIPVWKVGDEWQYAYKSPSDSGTYVWSVNRVETLDEAQHYVIKTGTREIFYRVSDLASSLERVDGVVILREAPSRLAYLWPLTVGKTWEQTHRQERPVDRTTTDRNSLWTVESEETVTVPAGTFRTLKITWRNKNTGALNYEVWYAPDVKQWVRIREILANGVREREMIAVKLN